MVRKTTTLAAALALAIGAEAALVADVLVLRDGRRIDGVLVGVRGETIEFEGSDRRVRRYERAEVRSVQFEDWAGGGDRYRDDRTGDSRLRAGMRERSVSVTARTRWTDTGVDVRGGQDVFFAATGETRWGPGRSDGAAGERSSPFNRSRPMPDRSAAALIGKIGENGDPFFIGDLREAVRVRGSGRLFLGINDDYLNDNSGSLHVVIGY
jgi:hypothetical protein